MYSVYWYDMLNNVSKNMHFDKLSEAIDFLKKLKKAYKKGFYFCLNFQV